MPTTPPRETQVRQIFPVSAGGPPGCLSPDQLAGLYAYPAAAGRDGGEQARRHGPAWLRANMVTSADGAATLRGRTSGLSGAADRQVFAILRSLADVILVGAQTARAERYQPARQHEIRAELRAGRAPTPPIAVVTRRLGLDTDAPLLTAAPPDARTIVITTELAPADRRAAAAEHADVIVAGGDTVDLAAALAALAGRGYRRVLTEGGPHLLGQLASAGLLDELCLTVSPVLAGPGAGRIAAGLGPGGAPAALPGSAGPESPAEPASGRPLALAHVLESGGFLLCRYVAHAG